MIEDIVNAKPSPRPGGSRDVFLLRNVLEFLEVLRVKMACRDRNAVVNVGLVGCGGA